MRYFRIKNWDVYQHYKDRSPPWIKLHRELLTSQTWVMLDDEKKALAIACMLIAAGTDNKIPFDAAYIQRVAYLKKTPDLKPLIQFDFIELIEENTGALANASNPDQALANDTERPSEERRDRGETEEMVREVFDHWKATHGHPRASLDSKRIKLIRDALKIQPAEILKQSISGYKNSPHHMGQNERKTVYDDIELLLRDAKHIDAGLKFFEKGAPTQWQ